MKKEIGKWLMDIAKYVVTGGIISTFISNYQQQSWIIYIGNYIPVYTSLSIIITNSHKLIGIEFVRNKERR